jgi:hypothetical protein
MRLFLSALVLQKIFFIFFRTIDLDLIIALKKSLVNIFLIKSVDNSKKLLEKYFLFF